MNTFSDLICDWKQLKTDIQEASSEKAPSTPYFLKISALFKKPDCESKKKLDEMRNSLHSRFELCDYFRPDLEQDSITLELYEKQFQLSVIGVFKKVEKHFDQ